MNRKSCDPECGDEWGILRSNKDFSSVPGCLDAGKKGLRFNQL